MDKVQAQARIDAVRRVLDTPGWKALAEDWSTDRTALERQAAYNAKNFEEVAFARGALHVLGRLLNLEKMLDAAEESLKEPAEAAE